MVKGYELKVMAAAAEEEEVAAAAAWTADVCVYVCICVYVC